MIKFYNINHIQANFSTLNTEGFFNKSNFSVLASVILMTGVAFIHTPTNSHSYTYPFRLTLISFKIWSRFFKLLDNLKVIKGLKRQSVPTPDPILRYTQPLSDSLFPRTVNSTR